MPAASIGDEDQGGCSTGFVTRRFDQVRDIGVCGLAVSLGKPRVPHCEERHGAVHSRRDHACALRLVYVALRQSLRLAQQHCTAVSYGAPAPVDDYVVLALAVMLRLHPPLCASRSTCISAGVHGACACGARSVCRSGNSR